MGKNMGNVENLYSKYNTSNIENNRGFNPEGEEINLSLTKDEDGSGVPRLKFPADIDTNAAKAFKSMTLYILKDVSYTKLIEAATNAYNKGKEEAKRVKGNDELSVKKIIDMFLGGAVAGLSSLSTDIKAAMTLKSEDFHCVITIPIPNNLTEDDQHSYEEGSWDKSLLQSGVKAIHELSDNISHIGQTAAQFGQEGDRRKSKQLAQVPILNPFTWKKFQGSHLKTFRFTTFFVPRSAYEAEQIMKIVYTLKKYSYGKQGALDTGIETLDKASDFFVQAPPKFLLKFGNPMLQKLLNPGVCVLESIGITYNEGNSVGMTADGIPRFIEVNVALTEYNVRFQNDF